MIPLASHAGRCVREAVWCWQNGLNWGLARERIAMRFAGYQPCHCVPNSGFVILGWLYGKDFGDRLCKAVNCGYDTDCTGATLGATLGILEGTAGIPKRWQEPIGLGIVLHQYTRFLKAPKDMKELTERTIPLAEKAAQGSAERAFGETTVKPADLRSRLFRAELAGAARAQDIHAAVVLAGGREVTFHYGGEPVLWPGVGREVSITVAGQPDARVEMAVPSGWSCERLGPARFRISSAGPVAARNEVKVQLPGGAAAAFTVLGPDEAKGFPAGDNVPKCNKCWARIEACVCPK